MIRFINKAKRNRHEYISQTKVIHLISILFYDAVLHLAEKRHHNKTRQFKALCSHFSLFILLYYTINIQGLLGDL